MHTKKLYTPKILHTHINIVLQNTSFLQTQTTVMFHICFYGLVFSSASVNLVKNKYKALSNNIVLIRRQMKFLNHIECKNVNGLKK